MMEGKAGFVTALAALSAVISLAALPPVQAQPTGMATQAWLVDLAPRIAPRFHRIARDCAPGAAGEECATLAWRRHLFDWQVRELEADPGHRAYRLFILKRRGHDNRFIEADIAPDGTARVKTLWARDPALDRQASELAAFEAALALSDYAILPMTDPQPPGAAEAECPRGQDIVLEAIVDGRYRYANWNCEVTNAGVAAAIDLFVAVHQKLEDEARAAIKNKTAPPPAAGPAT